MVCLMGLLVLTNPLTHVKAAGYDARQACGAIEPFASFRQRPADPGEWIDGCADALHDRGMR